MKSVFRITVVCIALGCLIVGYYYYLSHSLSGSEEVSTSDISELDRVLTQDFNNNYPGSPKEVVRWYNRIITLYYAQDLKDKELEALCDQAQKLLDPELVAANPRSQYIQSVKLDIQNYKARKRKIISSDVGSTSDVKKAKVKGDDMAYVTSYYLVTDGSDYNRSYQTYTLRRNRDNEYKILGFVLSDEDGNPINE